MKQIADGDLPVTEEQALKVNSELRALRALWYSILCDSHGNVPLVTKYSDELPVQKPVLKCTNFVITELTEALPNL